MSGAVRWNVTVSALSETVMPRDRSHGLPILQAAAPMIPVRNGATELFSSRHALDAVTKVLGTNELAVGVSDAGPQHERVHGSTVCRRGHREGEVGYQLKASGSAHPLRGH